MSDYKLYSNYFEESNIEDIIKINNLFKESNIEMKVIIMPYEYQIRFGENQPSLLLPQELLTNFFKKNKIQFIDAYRYFKNNSRNSRDLFLPFDPMHLSSYGHQILFDIINKDIKNL